MSRAPVVLDFFGLEKANSSQSQFQKFLHRRKSFRDLQGPISPELLKTVIASGSLNQNHDQSGSLENCGQTLLHALPEYSPAPWPAVSEISSGTAPMTIFYNGTVTVYDVPRDKAESILKLAVEGGASDPKPESPSPDRKYLLETRDLPIFRKKSLQKFMEKRKERLTPTQELYANMDFAVCLSSLKRLINSELTEEEAKRLTKQLY